MNEGQYSRPR